MNEYKDNVVLVLLLDRAWIDCKISMAPRKKINKFNVGSSVGDETLKVTDWV